MTADVKIDKETKICKDCGKEKLLSLFRERLDINGKIYRANICRDCKNQKRKNWRKKKKLEKYGTLNDTRLVGLSRINDFVKEKHDGKCISDTYINSKTNLLFECKWGASLGSRVDKYNERKMVSLLFMSFG